MLAARGMMVSRETVDCMVFCGCLFNLMDFRLPEIFAKRFFGWRQCVLQSVLVGEPPTLHCVFKTLWQRWFQAALRFKEVGMFKNLIKRVLPKKRAAGKVHCVRHAVKLAVRNQAALRVLESLHRAGFEAYLVGGAVRDLLLGIEPKDFDVATSATPEQVHRLFRRSRIIGRRFQIVHVMQGSETIEVSTFRSGGRVMQNASGRIMRDNAYGSLEQDAMRRDFTCNALYYDVAAQQVLDFHGGWEDVAARRLVMIGDAAERYQEDPVRMLRAARLSGKLGFAVEAATAAPIGEMGLLLRHEPVARLFDELLKILLSGNAAGCLAALRRLGLTEAVHPLLSAMLRAADGGAQHVGLLALQQTDARLGAGKSVSVGFMLAALFWQDVDGRWQAEMGCGTGAAAAMGAAVNGLRGDMERGWGVPQRYSATMREIWLLQPQFAHQRGGRPFRLLAQARFRAAYDFLLLRAQMDEDLQPLADWWMRFQHASDADKRAMVEAAGQQSGAAAGAGGAKKKRRRRKKSSGE